MSDVYEIVNYEGVDRPEYILRNGRPLNIFGAKKMLESQMEQIERLSEQVKRFADALISSQEKVDTLRDKLTMANEWLMVECGYIGSPVHAEISKALEKAKATQ